MNGNLLIGFGVMAVCVIIQCVAVAVLLQFFHRYTDKHQPVFSMPRSAGMLTMAMLIMFCGNLFQMGVWAVEPSP